MQKTIKRLTNAQGASEKTSIIRRNGILVLDIEPGFTIHSQLMRLEKGELETLAEWPPIRNISDR